MAWWRPLNRAAVVKDFPINSLDRGHTVAILSLCGVWWLIGRFGAFRRKGRGLESPLAAT